MLSWISRYTVRIFSAVTAAAVLLAVAVAPARSAAAISFVLGGQTVVGANSVVGG